MMHGEKVLICPRCNIEMKKLKKEEVVIDICRKCEGMWLDKGEIKKLLNLAHKKLPKKKGVKKNGKKK